MVPSLSGHEVAKRESITSRIQQFKRVVLTGVTHGGRSIHSLALNDENRPQLCVLLKIDAARDHYRSIYPVIAKRSVWIEGNHLCRQRNHTTSPERTTNPRSARVVMNRVDQGMSKSNVPRRS